MRIKVGVISQLKSRNAAGEVIETRVGFVLHKVGLFFIYLLI